MADRDQQSNGRSGDRDWTRNDRDGDRQDRAGGREEGRSYYGGGDYARGGHQRFEQGSRGGPGEGGYTRQGYVQNGVSSGQDDDRARGEGGYGAGADRYGEGNSGYGQGAQSGQRGWGGAQGGDYGFAGQGGGGSQWGDRSGALGTSGPNAAGAAGRTDFQSARNFGGGGTYGQDDYGRAAQRSTARTDQGGGGTGQGPTYGQDRSGQDAYERRDLQTSASGSRFEEHHEPSYRDWHDRQMQGHDRDYARWRDDQSTKYHADYSRYRDERHGEFARGFNDWRSKDNSRLTDTGSTTQALQDAATRAGATGSPSTSNGGAGSTASAGGGSTAGSTTTDAVKDVADGGVGRADKDDHR